MINRIGFHYFPDTLHYQVKNLSLWLPELIQMRVGWLVLKSPLNFAIPEEFIKGLLENQIQPVIHFEFQINAPVKPDDLKVVLAAYAKWGVKYVVFFSSPNLKSSWEEGTWTQGDLVEHFLDRYLPFAKAADQMGLVPILPPLQPGGDYWDTSFLKKMLLLIQQRKAIEMLTNLHIAVSAQTFNKPLDWGLGGSQAWHKSSPYLKSEANQQDHIGFQTWEWYTEIIEKALNITPKIMLFWYGASDIHNDHNLDSDFSMETMINLANPVESKPEHNSSALALGDHVIACMFWLLSASGSDPQSKTTWFTNRGEARMAAVEKLKANKAQFAKSFAPSEYMISSKVADWLYPIDHYLLLPTYEWGVPEHILERVRPIIRESQPTVGFSLSEATFARKVTIWNENNAFSEYDINLLRQSGCLVDEHIVNSMNVAV